MLVRLGKVNGLGFFVSFLVWIRTCNAPTTNVEVMNAHITPIANAKPNVFNGGRGEIMFARKADTVVITANVKGTESFAHALNHDSAGSEYCSLRVLFARCR